jgi:hypothetical protein
MSITKLFSRAAQFAVANPVATASDTNTTAASTPAPNARSSVRQSVRRYFRPIWATKQGEPEVPAHLVNAQIHGVPKLKDSGYCLDVKSAEGFVIATAIRKRKLSETEEKTFCNDVNTVLELAKCGGKVFKKKAADFDKAYGRFLKCDFRDEACRANLRGALSKNLRGQPPSKANTSRPLPASTAWVPVRPIARLQVPSYTGFNQEVTSKAFQIIRAAYQEKWGKQWKEDQAAVGGPVSAEGETSALITGTKVSTGKVLSAESQKRYNAYLNKHRTELGNSNAMMRRWLGANGLVVAPNSGHGLNCLIISLLQHATGDYTSGHITEANALRKKLGGTGMLHSSGEQFVSLVNMINERHGASLDVWLVQADSDGRPFIEPREEPIEKLGGKNPVVIWQQGAHFEALIAPETRRIG